MMRVLSVVIVASLSGACGTEPQAPIAPAKSTTLTPTPPSAPAIATAIQPTIAASHHCEGSPTQCRENAAPPAPQPVAGGEMYGAAFDHELDLTPLPTLLARPAEFVGKVVRTTGTIGRVCEHRGCWMELRVAGSGTIARIPMAGHAFFVPPDSSGRTATVQGEVSVADGRDNPLRIDATAVLIASVAP